MLNRITGIWIVAFILATIVGCDSISSLGSNKTKQKDAAEILGPALATVNGVPVSKGLFDAYLEQRNARRQFSGTPEELNGILKELIDMEVVYQDAQRNGIENKPEIAGQLELQRRGFLVRADLQEYVLTHPVTDEELRAIYEQQVAQLDKEYKARHILSKSEEEARAIIASLDGGADFTKVAEEHSTGPTAKQGGDLGWFPPNRMVAPFSEAVVAMQKGTYTKEPVHTQFGWHVILLEDVRDAVPPSFEQLQGQIKATAQNERVQQYLGTLRDAAKIEIIADSLGAKPVPAEEAAPPAEEAAPPAEDAEAAEESAPPAADTEAVEEEHQ